MSDPAGGIPELETYDHQQGRPKTRLEMEQWLREKIPKVHWLRIIACKAFHLPKPISWDMREIVLKHWLLDEMIRRQQITGDVLGVNQTASNDEGELRQFTQRLGAMVQMGLAVPPHHAEGIDMNFTPPPPPNMPGAPAPQNGQTQHYAAPPGPPPGPPAPQMPAGPPGGYAQPPGPPGPPQQMQQTQMPGPGFQAPPQQPPALQQGAPMGPPGFGPPPGPPMSGPPMTPPPSGPPQQAAGGRGRGRKPDSAPSAAPPAAPVPPMNTVPGPPGGFAPLPAGAPSFAPPAGIGVASGGTTGVPVQFSAQPSAAAPSVDLTPVLQQIAALTQLVQSQAQQIAALQKQATVDSMVTTILARAIYSKPGTAVAADFLTEMGLPLPQ